MNSNEIEKVRCLKNDIQKKLLNETELQHCDLNEYVRLLKNYPDTAPYNYVDPHVERLYNDLIKQYGCELAEDFHKLILVKLILDNVLKVKDQFPECVREQFYTNFKRIANHINRNSYSPGFYLYPNVNFLKDLCVCAMRLIPIGTQKIETSGFSRSFVFKGGLRQFLDASIYIWLKSKGNKPYYQMHTDTHDRDSLRQFTKKGVIATWLRVGKLLEKNKRIKGLFGSSWMNDPQLEKISPIIYYGAKIAVENGGKLYYTGITPNTVDWATVASPKRKRLFDEGKYSPANYILIWRRDCLLNWAMKQPFEEFL